MERRRAKGGRCAEASVLRYSRILPRMSEATSHASGAPPLLPPSEQVRIIAPGARRGVIDWRELWSYRELLAFVAWRDVKLRYRQTTLGVAWALLQPLALMAVFAMFFGRLAGLAAKTGGAPYPLFVFAGLLPWSFFATAVAACGNSLVGNAQIVTKVYFPRLIIPLATVLVGLLDLAVSLLLLVGLMIYYGTRPGWALLLSPFPLLGVVVVTVGVGAFLAALTVAYRDFRFVVPFLVQLWLFVTPVIYPSALVPERWRLVQALNPLAGLLDAFRACVLGLPLEWPSVIVSGTVGVLAFFAGAAYFRSIERRLADVI